MEASERVQKFNRCMNAWKEAGPLWKWRNSLGISLQAAAHILCVNASTYQKWEKLGIKINRIKDGVKIKVRPRPGHPFLYTTWEEWCRPRTGITEEQVVKWLALRPRLDA